jgi:hypothetical protein
MTDKLLNRPLAAVAVPLVGRPITKEEAAALIAKNFNGAPSSAGPQPASYKVESRPARG